MRAICYVGKEHVRCESVEAAKLLDPHDAIVKIDRRGICGSDPHFHHGQTATVSCGDSAGSFPRHAASQEFRQNHGSSVSAVTALIASLNFEGYLMNKKNTAAHFADAWDEENSA